MENTEKANDGSILGLWGVRYQVKDVSCSVAFYTGQLGLKLDQQRLPAFAQVPIGNLQLILSGAGASGSRPMPDGRSQEPGPVESGRTSSDRSSGQNSGAQAWGSSFFATRWRSA